MHVRLTFLVLFWHVNIIFNHHCFYCRSNWRKTITSSRKMTYKVGDTMLWSRNHSNLWSAVNIMSRWSCIVVLVRPQSVQCAKQLSLMMDIRLLTLLNRLNTSVAFIDWISHYSTVFILWVQKLIKSDFFSSLLKASSIIRPIHPRSDLVLFIETDITVYYISMVLLDCCPTDITACTVIVEELPTLWVEQDTNMSFTMSGCNLCHDISS